MKLLSAKNPIYANSKKTKINLIVDFEHCGEVPFTADATDSELHGREIFKKAEAGDFGVVAEFQIDSELPMYLLRRQRDMLLTGTDWQATSDRTMSQEQTDYRQELRDLPSTASPALDSDEKLTGVTWPVKP